MALAIILSSYLMMIYGVLVFFWIGHPEVFIMSSVKRLLLFHGDWVPTLCSFFIGCLGVWYRLFGYVGWHMH